MRERCRVCNQRKKAVHERICTDCINSWLKFSRMAVRGL